MPPASAQEITPPKPFQVNAARSKEFTIDPPWKLDFGMPALRFIADFTIDPMWKRDYGVPESKNHIRSTV